MPIPSRNSAWSLALWQRRMVLAVLLNYALVCFGLPLPTWTTGQELSQPYPCQGHACGCRTAEQCWRSCCCKTMREKLAWARTNDVEPPAYVVVAAEQESPTQKAVGCCGGRAKLLATTCSVPSAPAISAALKNSPRGKPAGRVVKATKLSVDWVFYARAERCQGGSASTWMNVPISLPLEMTQVALSGELLSQYLAGSPLPCPLSPADPPPAPPPRLA